MNGIIGISIISFFCVFLTIFLLRKINKNWLDDFKQNPLLYVIFAATGGLVLVIVMLISPAIPISHSEAPSAKVEIISLETSHEVEGSFILGCGSIGSEMVYYFYQVLPDGSFRLESVPAKSATIKEYDPTPNLISGIERYDRVTWQQWLVPVLDRFNGAKFIIYIPKGSIVQQYNPMVTGR